MEYIKIANTDLCVSRLGMGMMRIAGLSVEELEERIAESMALGINFYDHADIYGEGKCEQLFGEVLKRSPGLRKKMILQTKCDIVPGRRYDTSREHILHQVEQSLERLHTDYLDILLLHRPDALCDPAELAETFDELHEKKLVRYFGVSNHGVGRIALLNRFLSQPIVINQMQFSIVHSHMLDSGIFVNMSDDRAISRDNDMIDYCRLHDITLQAWCPLQASWEDGTFIDNPKYVGLNAVLCRLADKYAVTKGAIATAWILRHPANMQVITGTTSVSHLRENCEALKIHLTRQEWYDLYLAENKPLP